jgi:hypothetical protein
MKRWNEVQDPGLPCDKEILQNPDSWREHVVAAANSRVLVEIMEWIEANDIQKAAVEAPTGSPGKGKKT